MTRPLGKWKLPQPTDVKVDNEWVDIPRISRTIPFGYIIFLIWSLFTPFTLSR